jgi:hypothetical protein
MGVFKNNYGKIKSLISAVWRAEKKMQAPSSSISNGKT